MKARESFRAGLALAGSLACACQAPPWGSGGDQTTAGVAITVQAVDFEAVVVARGELESVKASPVAVPQVPTGALTVKELAPEGSIVEKGDIVVRFDDTQLNIDVENHAASLRSAQRRIDRTQIQSAIERGAIEVMKGIAVLERDHADSFVIDDELLYSRIEILENGIRRREAGETIAFADMSLLLRGEYYEIDERILRVQEEKAAGKKSRVETSLGQLVLRAPIGGMITYKKNWRGSTVAVGDSLWPGNVIVSIVDPTQTAMKAWLLEREAAGVKEGTPAIVRIDARADREFHGRVKSISKLSSPIESGSPVKYFEAVIEIDDGDPELLKPGMKGEVRLTTATAEDAVVVPRSAVHGEEGRFHVIVVSADGPRRRSVELGPGDHVRVSIASGLQPGERVLIGGRPAVPARPADSTTASGL